MSDQTILLYACVVHDISLSCKLFLIYIYIHEICILLMASRCQGSLLDDRDAYIVVPYIYIYHDI